MIGRMFIGAGTGSSISKFLEIENFTVYNYFRKFSCSEQKIKSMEPDKWISHEHDFDSLFHTKTKPKL